MKHLSFLLALFAIVTALSGLAQEPIAPKDRMVVVISLDGFAAEAFENPFLPIPVLRRLASEGARAKGMTPVNPTVTWPNHTTLVTGVTAARHSVLFNGQAQLAEGMPVTVEPWLDKDILVAVPTVYDLAHKAGLTTAEVDWVAIQNAKTITWAFPEIPNVDGRVEQEMIQAGLVTADEVREFRKRPITWRDDVWLRAGIHILTRHKPNLMLFHLLNTDSVQHRYGPGSLAADTSLAHADSRVGEILNALQKANLIERTTVIVVSDHGFIAVQRNIQPNAILLEQGLLREEQGKLTTADVHVVPEGGTAMLYITRNGRRAELLPKLRELFGKVEGVSRVLGPEEFAEYGYPSREKNPRMADLVLAAKPGYAFTGSHRGEPIVAVPGGASTGSHGYLNTEPDMTSTFIAWGNGIRPGARLGMVRAVDVAPTIAVLLGLKLENVEGAPLREILK
jgi:predicted AlkP superfamily pyrophosphatase or phosphodiesterase